ncbi:predicted protein [Histoplasma mississippiense (nom. inval.)]|uniref:predicted protein n=1 Tax=Ajellomyces capsulatus (strain NAm1 / WU24) TaxID=2059318 RepID=UPI000157BC6E|nr:predicted protein [Histoplasma mississippiense (nom. inval.)]EDN06335.1 predicted protein [Histoplasma mississippiense (nom. inval.)]
MPKRHDFHDLHSCTESVMEWLMKSENAQSYKKSNTQFHTLKHSPQPNLNEKLRGRAHRENRREAFSAESREQKATSDIPSRAIELPNSAIGLKRVFISSYEPFINIFHEKNGIQRPASFPRAHDEHGGAGHAVHGIGVS